MSQVFDVIVVGGRIAGAALASLLGQKGIRVLLLDRATFPSATIVSCPLIFSPAMSLLDEIGVSEEAYAAGCPRLTEWITEIEDKVISFASVPNTFGRAYSYAIDRSVFDNVLWEYASCFPTVTAIQGFAVSDLLWDGEIVVGVTGIHPDTKEQAEFRADTVIGADGRFSIVARKVEAADYDQHVENPTNIYYAYWKGVQPFDNDHQSAIHLVAPGNGCGILVVDSADGLSVVAIEGRADVINPDGSIDTFYENMVRSSSSTAKRLIAAQRATEVRGMKNIGNQYREVGGPGWMLVGDAVHQVDPLDGQGIFDALFTAKALSTEYMRWRRGELSWYEALAAYQAAIYSETEPMYRATLQRVYSEFYLPRSQRWMVYLMASDKQYFRRRSLLISRGFKDPSKWLSGSFMVGSIVRGAGVRLSHAIRGHRGPVQVEVDATLYKAVEA